MVILRNRYNSHLIIKQLTETFGGLTLEELSDFYQWSTMSDSKKKEYVLDRIEKCKKSRYIRYDKTNKLYYPIITDIDYKEALKKTNTEQFKKCFLFLRWLFQLKDNENFRYYHKISSIEFTPYDPSQLAFTLNSMFIHIQYCPVVLLKKYEELETKKDNSNIYQPYHRILIVDDYFDTSKLNVNRLLNIAVIKDKNIEVIA